MSSLARRLFGLAAGTLALLVVADASAKPAAKKDDDAEEADKKPTKKPDPSAKSADAEESDAPAKGAKKPAKGGDDDAKDAKDGDDDEDDKAEAAKKKKAEVVRSSSYEKEGQDYYFVGLRYRHTFLPKFILNLFVDGGPSVVSLPSFGIEASKRRDNFEMIGALSYQSWGMDPFPFKGKGENDFAYEIVESKLKMLKATADFLWSAKISGDQLQFLYGVTAGLAFVWGDLIHQQAHPANGTSPGDPKTYQVCQLGNATSGTWAGNYCNSADNQRWAGYVEPSWAGGGYRPILFLSFGPQFGLRYKAAKQFVARLDVGFDIFSGFFFGLGADYGI